MAGPVSVSGETGFEITTGITGSWFDPETGGQGLSLEVVPSQNQLVVYWFTYADDATGQQWMTGSGSIDGNQADALFTAYVGAVGAGVGEALLAVGAFVRFLT